MLPGFSATSSLYRSRHRYQGELPAGGAFQGTQAVLQGGSVVGDHLAGTGDSAGLRQLFVPALSCVGPNCPPSTGAACGTSCIQGCIEQSDLCLASHGPNCGEQYQACTRGCDCTYWDPLSQCCNNQCVKCVGGTVGSGCNCDCPSGKTNCSGVCTDTNADPGNCGGCRNACPEHASCKSGKCQCPWNLPNVCSDICVSLSDPSNCGSCGNSCSTGSLCCLAGAIGEAYECTDSSSDTLNCGECGNICSIGAQPGCCNGECLDLSNDISNCGACGWFCPELADCVSGTCECPSPTTQCPGKSDLLPGPSFTCVSDFNTDPKNCGKCGVVCPAECCDGLCTDVTTDSNNCGSCGKPCPQGQNCCGGTCVDLSSNVSHCGACDNPCSFLHLNCCDGVCSDTSWDSRNCGGCEKACGSRETCCAGTCCGKTCCGVTCVDTSTDVNNCGFCGNRCSSGQNCCGGACSSPQTDPNNCGVCGNRCSSGQMCCSGSCVSNDVTHCGDCTTHCASGQNCCGGSCSDPQTDSNNCGGCGNRCSRGQKCCDGRCIDCPSGATQPACCGNVCVDVGSDPQNCGSCGDSCEVKFGGQPSGLMGPCKAGNCFCPTDFACCSSSCLLHQGCCPSGQHCCPEERGCCQDGFECCPVTALSPGCCRNVCCSAQPAPGFEEGTATLWMCLEPGATCCDGYWCPSGYACAYPDPETQDIPGCNFTG